VSTRRKESARAQQMTRLSRRESLPNARTTVRDITKRDALINISTSLR
jgi:hypothetical protein